MSHERDSHSGAGRQAKRQQFASPGAPARVNKYIPWIAIAGIGIGAYLFGSSLRQGPEAATPVTASPSAVETAPYTGDNAAAVPVTAPRSGQISIPISQVTGKARFFRYTSTAKKDVRFFVIKSSDGVYRAALDTCDVCYDAKKGYYQDGDDMVCRKCSRRFPSALVNEVSGGCNPVGVRRMIVGESLVINAADLESGSSYF